MKTRKYLSIVIIGLICWYYASQITHGTSYQTSGEGVNKSEYISIPIMFFAGTIMAFILLIVIKSSKK